MKYRSIADAIDNATSDKKPFDRYDIPQFEIESAEAEIGRTFPEALKEFWSEIGGGFINSSITPNSEKIDESLSFQSPLNIADEIKAFPDRFANAIPFFDLSDDCWLVILPDGRIAWDDDHSNIVSDTFEGFVLRVFEEPLFWISSSAADKLGG